MTNRVAGTVRGSVMISILAKIIVPKRLGSNPASAPCEHFVTVRLLIRNSYDFIDWTGVPQRANPSSPGLTGRSSFPERRRWTARLWDTGPPAHRAARGADRRRVVTAGFVGRGAAISELRRTDRRGYRPPLNFATEIYLLTAFLPNSSATGALPRVFINGLGAFNQDVPPLRP
jgi:hypothetical protein